MIIAFITLSLSHALDDKTDKLYNNYAKHMGILMALLQHKPFVLTPFGSR